MTKIYKIENGVIIDEGSNENSVISQIIEKWKDYFDKNEAGFYCKENVDAARRKFVKSHLGENYPQPGEGEEYRLTICRDRWLRYSRK